MANDKLAASKAEKKGSITTDIQVYGGLWRSPEEIKFNVQNMDDGRAYRH